jgi:hypothetical protein
MLQVLELPRTNSRVVCNQTKCLSAFRFGLNAIRVCHSPVLPYQVETFLQGIAPSECKYGIDPVGHKRFEFLDSHVLARVEHAIGSKFADQRLGGATGSGCHHARV